MTENLCVLEIQRELWGYSKKTRKIAGLSRNEPQALNRGHSNRCPARQALRHRAFDLSNRGLFRVCIALSKQEGELGEFETVMQTRDTVKGLHNCLEISQLPLLFRWGYVNTEKVLYCFYKIC